MKKDQLTVMVSNDSTKRIEKIAERFGMSRTQVIAMIAEELSHVRPEAFFEAIGAIPADLKARPVGRPQGSTKREKSAA